jgi:hypothetical protein
MCVSVDRSPRRRTSDIFLEKVKNLERSVELERYEIRDMLSEIDYRNMFNNTENL